MVISMVFQSGLILNGYGIDMDDLYNGVEAFRSAIEIFLEEKFDYADQEIVYNRKIGTISRVAERNVGQPFKCYSESDGSELLSQTIETMVQINHMRPASYDDAKVSRFYSREVLGRLRTAYYGEEFQSVFFIERQKLNVEASVTDINNLTGPSFIEGSERVWSSSIDARLSIVAKYKKPDFPCLSRENIDLNKVILDFTE